MFKVVVICSICLIVLLNNTNAARHSRRDRAYLSRQNRQASATQKQVRATNLELSDGCGIPSVGMGTWQIGANDSEVARAIGDAIDVGYRHIDTAWLYKTEIGVGMAVKEAIESNRVKREDMFITSKVWNTYHRRPKVVESLRESLRNLGLEYLDLALIHYPTGFKEGKDNYPKYSNGSIIPRKWSKHSYIDTWKGMEDAVKLGLTRSIGVSNFNARQLKKVLDIAEIKPVINQVECHPYLNQQKLLNYCNKRGIRLEAYAPIRQADKQLLNDPVLKEIAAKHNKTAAQVAFRWQLQRGVVVIPKSARKTRQLENIDIFDFEISDSDMRRIDGMETKARIYDIEGNQNHPDYPFRASYKDEVFEYSDSGLSLPTQPIYLIVIQFLCLMFYL